MLNKHGKRTEKTPYPQGSKQANSFTGPPTQHDECAAIRVIIAQEGPI